MGWITIQTLLIGVALVLPCQSIDPNKYVLPRGLGGLPFHRLGLQNYRMSVNATEFPDLPTNKYEKFFVQKLDQINNITFNKKNNFKQRYFVNTQWKKNNGIHILYIEGENIANESKVVDVTLPHVALAKDLGATVWSLEHRWRGKSQPLPYAFAANYRDFLSSAQAVEDIAAFIKGQNKNLGRSNAKWIVFGQNYGGNLALLFRQKYPSLTVGAVSDSANIVPIPDFYTYEKLVEEAYSNHSYACWHGVKFSALAVRNELQYPNGVDRLNDELKFYPKINDYTVDYKNLQNLHSNMIQMFELPIVYNQVNYGPFANCCGVVDVCKIFSNERIPTIDRVYDLAKLLYTNIYGSKQEYDGIPNSYELMVKWINQTKHDRNDIEQPSARSWLYQQCYEYGQFVTTDFGHGLFSNTVPLDYFIGLCTDAFEEKIVSFTIDKLNSAIQNTTLANKVNDTYTGSNTLVFNGEHDPWKLVGVRRVTDSSSTLTNLVDIGHAAVLQPVHPNDPTVLGDARNSIKDNVNKWISGQRSQLETNTTANKAEAKLEETNQEESEQLPEIKNWIGKIHYSPNGEPPTDSPSYRANSHKKLQGQTKVVNKYAAMRKKLSLTHQIRRLTLNRAAKLGNSTSVKKRYAQTYYITQDVDHFDKNSDLTFGQRYFKNDVFQEDRDACRFLMIGAEAPINWIYVDDDLFHYYLWAKDFKAVLYALEHRFFGYSAPFENTSVEVLSKYLTTEQVLADTAVFIQSMNVAENNTVKPRWVVFGGSYGGSLVAAFRVRYPQLSTGAIASSAPMQAKSDFYEYMEKVEQDVKKWGPVNCPSRIRRYFAFVRRKLGTRNGRKALKRAFCLSNNWDENYIDEKDSELFLANLVFTLDNVIQYDDESHYDLKYMCSYYSYFDYWYSAERINRHRKLSASADQLGALMHGEIPGSKSKYSKVRGAFSVVKADDRDDFYEGDYNYADYDDSIPSRYSDSESRMVAPACPQVYPCYYRGCTHVSYSELLQHLRNVYRKCFQGSECSDEDRLWFWISCSQWGWAESTNYGYNYFQSSLPVNHVLDICRDVFGTAFNRTRMDIETAKTNKLYGGKDNYNGTRIVFVNGSEDPWSTISVKKTGNRISHSYVINGTSHCEDMYREYEHDVQVLKDARKYLRKQIVRWVRRRKPTAD